MTGKLDVITRVGDYPDQEPSQQVTVVFVESRIWMGMVGFLLSCAGCFALTHNWPTWRYLFASGIFLSFIGHVFRRTTQKRFRRN